MLLSTAYNQSQTVLSNLYHCFTEVAQKSYHYIRSLPSAKQPSGKLLISKCSFSASYMSRKLEEDSKFGSFSNLHKLVRRPPRHVRPQVAELTGHPVRSGILKLRTGRSVLSWVTTGEYRLLYVLLVFFWRNQVRNNHSWNGRNDLTVLCCDVL